MENPGDFTIICSRCGAVCTDIVPLNSGEWLATCGACFQQDVVANEDFARAKTAGVGELSGKPLGSGAAKTKQESPLVRNARLRAEREVCNV